MTRLLIAVLLLLPSLAFAEGVLTPAANPPDKTLYDYRNSIYIQDDFLNGTSAATVGVLGWTVTGGTTTHDTGTTNRIGLLKRDTSASSGTLTYLELNGAGTRAPIDPANNIDLLWILKLNQVDVNTKLWAGAGNDAQVSVPADGIYIEKLDADTNWFCVTRAASTETRTDSGVAVAVAFTKLQFQRTSGQVRFLINDAVVCTHTTNITTTFLNPGVMLVNSAAASKTVTIDYFQMKIDGITR